MYLLSHCCYPDRICTLSLFYSLFIWPVLFSRSVLLQYLNGLCWPPVSRYPLHGKFVDGLFPPFVNLLLYSHVSVLSLVSLIFIPELVVLLCDFIDQFHIGVSSLLQLQYFFRLLQIKHLLHLFPHCLSFLVQHLQ